MQRARTDDAKDARRQALLEAALEEFFEHGFAAARMDRMARRAGLSKGTVYLYFDSKEALFRALIDDLTAPNIEQLERIAAQAPSVIEAFNALAIFLPNLIRTSRIPQLIKLIISESKTFPEIVEHYRSHIIERIFSTLSQRIQRGIDEGELRAVPPELATRLLAAPMVLSGIWEAVFNPGGEAPVDLDALFALHADFLTRALTVDPQG